ncbi:hypothetical protein WICPIJ_003701 [Wickerhamomyces pijperi]|uniref:Uncharacterized protein n=1 Tax=Wickerhamomyces pijperi TaxID=599730 RepID=A0A9P8Q9I4_WICPI|nr:hypothetical protein WICPIJ_003701 [Wickerhamomyces pijperi]
MASSNPLLLSLSDLDCSADSDVSPLVGVTDGVGSDRVFFGEPFETDAFLLDSPFSESSEPSELSMSFSSSSIKTASDSLSAS